VNTIDVFGLALPLEVLLYLGIAILIACCVLTLVIGLRVGEQRTQESVDRALGPGDDECAGCAAADERNEQVGDDTLALFGEHEPRTDVEGIVVGGKHFATAEEFGEWFRNRPAVREVLHDECIEDIAATGAERLDVEIFDLLHDTGADS